MSRDLLDHLLTVCADPWRWKGEGLRIAAEGIGPVVDYAQSQPRMVAAAEALHGAIVSRRLRHHGERELDAHISAAVPESTPRGWRLTRASRADKIDAAVALAMAVTRAEALDAEPMPAPSWVAWLDVGPASSSG